MVQTRGRSISNHGLLPCCYEMTASISVPLVGPLSATFVLGGSSLLSKVSDFGYTALGIIDYAHAGVFSHMPKKLPPRHQPQRPQPKKKDVPPMRASSATQVVESAEEEIEERASVETPKATETKARPATPSKALERRPERPVKSAAQPTRPLAASQRSGKPGQRPAARLAVGRQSNLVTAEHYRYVLKDLRLIAILAVVMFGFIIAMTFVLPHFLQY